MSSKAKMEAQPKKAIVLLNAKSKFQNAREAKEAKAKAEQDAAAAVYSSFVASFNDDEDHSRTTQSFVRSGAFSAGDDIKSDNTGRQDALVSRGPRRPLHDKGSDISAVAASIHSGKKPREMDLFLEEIKSKNAKDRASSTTGDRSNRGADDAMSANIHVANLAPQVTEDMVQKLFGRYGPITSVKILWPRTLEEKARQKNTGFVNFVHRRDAEDAMKELHDMKFEGQYLALSWGKSMRSAFPAADAVPTTLNRITHSLAPSTTVATERSPDIAVVIPINSSVRAVIDELAVSLAAEGTAFHSQWVTHFAAPPMLSPSNQTYLRWRVFSLLQHDSLTHWRTQPFVMQEDGHLWIPPACSSHAGGATGNSPPRSLHRADDTADGWRGRNKLRAAELDEWLRIVGHVGLERHSVSDAMGFALDHATCAKDVVEALFQAIQSPSSSAPLQVARLYVISDVLHNSSAGIKNASQYRSELQAVLPEVFEALAACYRSISGRFTSEAMRDRVLRVLAFWEKISIFPPVFLSGLESTFLRRPADEDGSAFDAMDEASLPADEIRRKCVHSGLSLSGSTKDLFRRIAWLTVYVQSKTGAETLAPTQPVHASVVPTGPLQPLPSASLPPQVAAPAEVSEDIDAPPLDADDIDGVPLGDRYDEEDIDGEPLEDEDIDGVPLS
jgi:U2-associated protein SR140